MTRSLNISTRILILVFVLLNLMITGFSFGVSLLERLGGQVQLISDKEVPLIQVMTESVTAQLEQGVQFQRGLRFGKFMVVNADARLSFNDAKERFESISKKINGELKNAAHIMATLMPQIEDEGTERDFNVSLNQLDDVKKRRAAYAVHVDKIFYAFAREDYENIEADAAKVEAEQTALVAKLKEFLNGVERFTALTAIRVKERRLAFSNFMAVLSCANVAVALILAYFISRSIIKPIKAAVVIADKITAGLQNIHFEIESHDEIGQLLQTMNRMLTALQQAHAELLQANAVLESKVKERTRELEQKNLLLDRSNRDLEAFASVVAHDLKSPLFSVQLMADTLKSLNESALDEKAKKLLGKMKDSLARMQKLIDALLEYSVVTSKGRGFESVDLGATVAEVLADLDAQIKAKNAEITVGETMTVEADPVLMRQLLQNLVGNALKYQAEGTIPRIAIRTEKVTLEPDSSGSHAPLDLCLLSVSDNGVGFDEKYLQKIFLPFQRLYRDDPYGGLGLGLATCLKIAEYHHGGISAKSAPGKGATFVVTLPLKRMLPVTPVPSAAA